MVEKVGLNTGEAEKKTNINDQSSKGKGKHYICSESAFSRKGRMNKHIVFFHMREKGIVPIQKGVSNLLPPQKPIGNSIAILVHHLNQATTMCKLGY